MRSQKYVRFISIVVAFAFIFQFVGIPSVHALTPTPSPLSPSEGSSIIIPTFNWSSVTGAAKYEIEVGPQSNNTLVYWTGQTVNLVLTPTDSLKFTNEPLYWRVRAYDSVNTPSTWSGKVNFTKGIPAPTLVSPLDAASVVTPCLEWLTVQGAHNYKVELSLVETFTPVEVSYTTYNTRLIPVGTIAHGTHYWRVTGMDEDGHLGTPSASRTFIKGIPAPVLISPTDGHSNVHTPSFSWNPVGGAAYYKVELSTTETFVPIEETYTTYNTSLTPVDTFAHGVHYWRVSGVDADGNVGTASSGWSFTKTTDAPVLTNPGIDPTITTPAMEWAAVDGAAYYKVELAASSDFLPILHTFTTYNLSLTPVNALSTGLYYWRVSGVDADGHVGNNHWRRYTLNALPAATDPVPNLVTPSDGATLTADPVYSWTRVVGAADYRVVVSKYADFHATFESVITDYATYTPYTAGSYDAYPNDTYYWKVEARNGTGTVIAASAARSFIRQEPVSLVAPADGATGLVVDPTYQWGAVVGAKRYQITVSKYADFHATYESLYSKYTSYTPYTAGSYDAYPNGTYYWRIEAINSNSQTIATSPSRSFTKQETLTLASPADGATGLAVDPTYQWNQVIGAKRYLLTVSKYADFHAVFESLYSRYTQYTPYTAGSYDAYPNGLYYWRVEALNSNDNTIVTSPARSFTKQEPVVLLAPADNVSGLAGDPDFQWDPVIGADRYRWQVSKYADFHAIYDSVYTDYPTYTPYTAGSHMGYPKGTYYWRIEAQNSNANIISTSNIWQFSIGAVYWTYLPLASK